MIYLGNESSKLYLGDTLISQQNSAIKEYVEEVTTVYDKPRILDSIKSINQRDLLLKDPTLYDIPSKVLTGNFGGG